MLWDTAGQEEYDAITRAYYRGAQVCILVFSTTDKTSFLDIQKWKAKVGEVNHKNICDMVDINYEAV